MELKYDQCHLILFKSGRLRFPFEGDYYCFSLIPASYPANSPNFETMLDQRHRRWANIDSALGECLVFAGICVKFVHAIS